MTSIYLSSWAFPEVSNSKNSFSRATFLGCNAFLSMSKTASELWFKATESNSDLCSTYRKLSPSRTLSLL